MRFRAQVQKWLSSPGNLKNLIIWGLYVVFLCFYSIIVIVDYRGNYTGWHPPMPIWFLDVVNVFIHEGGHFFFGFFGTTIGILGGSLMQVLIPTLVIWFYRTNHYVLPLALFWLGESLINVSVYIADAPYRRLRLIAPNALHDWYYLAGRLGIRDSIEVFAEVIRFGGGVVLLSGCVVGIYFLVNCFRGSIVAPGTD